MSARRILNVAANVLLAVALLALIVMAAKRFSFTDHETKAYLSDDGSSVILADIDLSKSPLTVLLALRTTCRFCEQQTPFYRRLIKEAQSKNVSVIALFQEELVSAHDYLRAEEIDITNVLQVRLRRLGITETPTLLVVNQKGEILSKWVGRLPLPTESHILDMLDKDDKAIKRSARSFASVGPMPPTVELDELKKMVDGRRAVTILDVDNREAFAAEHLAAAKNIPSDELLMRAMNEIPAEDSVVLFSRHSRSVSTIMSARAALEQAGFTRVTWLNARLESCKRAGLEVTGGVFQPGGVFQQ